MNPRPTAITVICVIGFLGSFFAAALLFSPAASAVGSWYPPILGISIIGGLVSMIGMWMMKKWGVYLYTCLWALMQVVLISRGLWTPMSVVIPLVVIGIGFANLSKME